jgi:extracellular factor (EF) 3-hydroxypalmitic acid methyl ester biosynthesis protein
MSMLTDQEIVVLSDKREQAVGELQRHVGDFMALENGGLTEAELYHQLLAVVHQICGAILRCERVELTHDEIVDVLEPVRRVHARSPFVARLQKWPRGYPGDFETVEYIVAGENRAEDLLARSCEAYALSRAIAQQHRNKVQHQAARILRTMLANPGRSRIASIACGSCPDLRSIDDHLRALAGELWLNDADADALKFSRTALRAIDDRCRFVHSDALSAARRMPRNAFDLVLCGGLFDYLNDRTAVLLIQMTYRLLAAGGTFFFTNIAAGNPYRTLIEYFGNWTLIERTEEDIYTLCERAGIGRGNVTMRREETGLALIVEVTKLQ